MVLLTGIVELSWLPIDLPTALRWVLCLSIGTFVGSLVLVPILLVRMPADYFVRTSLPAESWPARHPVIRIGGRVVKNMLGLLFVLSGFVMLFIPGQGILVALLGLSLLDVPGKRTLEKKLVSHSRVSHAINVLRIRAGRPPLELGEATAAEEPTSWPPGPPGRMP